MTYKIDYNIQLKNSLKKLTAKSHAMYKSLPSDFYKKPKFGKKYFVKKKLSSYSVLLKLFKSFEIKIIQPPKLS